MRTRQVSIRLILMVGLCMVILGMSVCLGLVSAEGGSTTGPLLADQPPARPVYGPPGPKPGPTATATTQIAPTSTPAPAAMPTNAPVPSATSVAFVRPATCGLLTDFEQFGTWKRGDEPYGTFVQAADQAHSGVYSGKLSYSFPTAGNDYVVFQRTIPMGGAGRAVTAWVYGDNSGHFLDCWIKDAGGEIWSFPFGRIQHIGWQQMVALLDVNGAWPTGHISGPANGVLDYPISLYAIVLDDAPDTYVGSGLIYIDELSCAEVVYAPPVAPPAGPLQPPVGPLQPPVGPPQGPPAANCMVTLQEPANGAEFGAGTGAVTLRWMFNRVLDPREYFFVNVEFPHGGQTWYDGTWRDAGQQLPSGTRDTSWTLRDYLCQQGFSDTGWFQWYVTVMYQLGPEKSLSDGFVCRSEKRNFKWSGCEPTPAPSAPGGEYDLYVRRMDFTPSNPGVGQTVQMHVMIATDISPGGGPLFPASHFRWRSRDSSDWEEESCPKDTHYSKCEKTVSFSYGHSGNYTVKVEADSRDEVSETDEGNNDRKWTITVH